MTISVITLFLALVMVSGQLVALPVYLVLSLFTLLAFGLDKRRALVGGRRLPEKVLHGISLLGGWPGALVGMRQFRHKTQKRTFYLPLFGIVALHSVLWMVLAWQALLNR